MSITKELITLLTTKEQTIFLSLLAKRNKRHDTRNIQLFKAFLKGKEKTLLSDINPNAYNALKKRLTDLLIEFSASQALSSELSEENRIIKYVVTSRKLISGGAIKQGMTLLQKAELIAMDLDHHSLLNEIYHTLIEHAHKFKDVDLNSLFLNLKKNNDQFLAQEKLSILYAGMHQEFISGKFHNLPDQLHHSFKEGLENFDINPELALNFKCLNQLCILSDLYGSQTKNYNQLDLFFEKHIKPLQGSEKDTEKMLPYHIELLYRMANIYFRKKELNKSQAYLESMKIQLNRFSGKHKTRWIARLKNHNALNLNFSGAFHEAIKQLSEVLSYQEISEQNKSLLTLTLTMIHFQQEDLKNVRNLMHSLNRTDSWYLKHMGNEWLFNFKAIEILMHFDLGNDLLVESRINSFKRKYGDQIKNEMNNPIWPFLKLIQSVIYTQNHITSIEFSAEVEDTIPWKGENEDFFNLCFYAWLKAKMTKRSIYEVTLDLIN